MKNVDAYLLLFGIQQPSDYFSDQEIEFIHSTLSLDFEKAHVHDSDEWGNFNESILANTSVPYLDYFVLERLKERGVERKSIWPGTHTFGVCLTHDVDRVEEYSPRTFRRNIRKRFRYSTNFAERIKLMVDYLKNSIKQYTTKKTTDPIWNYEKWVEIEERYGVKSTYFFFTRTNFKDLELFDCDFALDDCFVFDNSFITVKQYIRLLKEKGFEIGLHGSFKSAENSEVFARQKQLLEQTSDATIVSTRQHYLHFHPHLTPEVHCTNNISIDSTLGLNKSSGYRVGTSMPFMLQTDSGYVWELPLIFMDSSVLGNQHLSLEQAKERVVYLMNQVAETGGCFTVNFHPDYVNEPDYFELYTYLLDIATEKNAYFGTCKDIIEVVNVWNSRNMVESSN